MASVETPIAREQAAKPRLVFFTSSLSGQCRRVEGFLAQVLQRRRNHGTFRVLVVDEDERPDLVSRFGVAGLPTLVVVEGHTRARAARAAARLPRDRRAARPLAPLTHAVSLGRVPGPNVPFPPMEAELVRELPSGDGWQYEPKWDGFRGVLENDGGELALWSRNERPLLRYFPELRPLGELLPPHSALDGEIVIARDGVLDFDSMQMRLHPAESRVQKLAAEIPAIFIAFDLLLWNGKPIHEKPLEQRRAELLKREGFWISPATTDLAAATAWLDRFEAAGLDGVIAKRLGLPYMPGSREAVVKVKEHKTADCVVVGVRWKYPSRKARDAAARPLPRGRRGRLRRLGRDRRPQPRRDRGARPAAPRRELRSPLLGAEPLGDGRVGGDAAAPGARRRGALRQGAGQPLPPRHEADPLPAGQGSGPVHLARGEAAAACGRPHRRDAAQLRHLRKPSAAT